MVVLILNESRGGDVVVVRPAIGSLAGLRGKRVGVSPSSLGPFVLSRALARESMTLADVRVVPIPLSAAAPRLASGELDGVALYPPFSDALLQRGLAIKVAETMGAREQISGQAFRESEAGLLYFPLAQQHHLLVPQGPVRRNLEAVQAVQRHLGLIHGNAALPPVSREPLRQALP